jgi:hypothetical protein
MFCHKVQVGTMHTDPASAFQAIGMA